MVKQKNMKKYSVNIAGSGSAGVACAKELKEEGVEFFIEKEKMLRHKICLNILFGESPVLQDKFFGAMPPDDFYCESHIINATDIQEWDSEKEFVS